MDIIPINLKDFVVFSGDHPARLGGCQVVMKFPNNYGASIIQTPFSYGGTEGKYELGVIEWVGDDWGLTYQTPVTDDVLGHLSESEVLDAIREIMALPVKIAADAA